MQLVIATANAKKRAELEAIAADLGLQLRSKADTVFVDVLEDGETFAENAQKKAVAFAKANNCAALADDSGLVVDVLGGRPGIYSARFAGAQATDAENNALLLQQMQGMKCRSAAFVCAVHVHFLHADDIQAFGKVEGSIVQDADGHAGFGYDPLFYSPELGKTFAQASAEEKASVSHRGRALRALCAQWPRHD